VNVIDRIKFSAVTSSADPPGKPAETVPFSFRDKVTFPKVCTTAWRNKLKFVCRMAHLHNSQGWGRERKSCILSLNLWHTTLWQKMFVFLPNVRRNSCLHPFVRRGLDRMSGPGLTKRCKKKLTKQQSLPVKKQNCVTHYGEKWYTSNIFLFNKTWLFRDREKLLHRKLITLPHKVFYGQWLGPNKYFECIWKHM